MIEVSQTTIYKIYGHIEELSMPARMSIGELRNPSRHSTPLFQASIFYPPNILTVISPQPSLCLSLSLSLAPFLSLPRTLEHSYRKCLLDFFHLTASVNKVSLWNDTVPLFRDTFGQDKPSCAYIKHTYIEGVLFMIVASASDEVSSSSAWAILSYFELCQIRYIFTVRIWSWGC